MEIDDVYLFSSPTDVALLSIIPYSALLPQRSFVRLYAVMVSVKTNLREVPLLLALQLAPLLLYHPIRG